LAERVPGGFVNQDEGASFRVHGAAIKVSFTFQPAARQTLPVSGQCRVASLTMQGQVRPSE